MEKLRTAIENALKFNKSGLVGLNIKSDDAEERFAATKDLSGRITPGVARQYRYFLGR